MNLQIVEMPAFQVVGIEVRTVNAAERTPATAKIPKLWKRFFEEKVEEQIPGKAEPERLYAVYHSYENDFNGFYSLLIGQKSGTAGPLPGALRRAEVEPQQYLAFPPVPAKPEEIAKVWQEVWNYFSQAGPFKRAYSQDFELYQNNTMQLHLAVADQ